MESWLLIALRNLRKHKTYSAINIFGLTIGLTSCLLIALYIRYELSFDRFQDKGDRIARVIMEYHFDGAGETCKGNFTSTKVAPAFRRNFPEVVSAVRMTDADRVVSYRDQVFSETRFMYADPLGQLLRVGTDSTLYQATGVMKDVPSNSHLRIGSPGPGMESKGSSRQAYAHGYEQPGEKFTGINLLE